MSWRQLAIFQDPVGLLLGCIRWLTFGGHGTVGVALDRGLLKHQSMLYQHDINNLKILIEQHPGRPEPIMVLAENFWASGEWNSLLDAGNTLIARFPNLVIGYSMTSIALVGLDQLDQAEAISRISLRRFPRSPEGHSAIAQVFMKRACFSDAVRHLKIVVARAPDQAYPRLALCRALKAMDQRSDANEIIRKSIDIFPRNFLILREYAYIAEEEGNWDEAARRWMLASSKNESASEFRIRAAIAMRRAGRLQDARKTISDALYIFPRDEGVLAESKQIEAALVATDNQ